ncbi:MAG TPA: hypothetical protein VK658_09475 [Chryseolinea sp.]|nr:hypothetical protein [Chryseolinea sp.]
MKNFIELLYIREETYCVNVNHDRRSTNCFNMVVEVWVKTENGLRYSIQRFQLVDNPAEHVNECVDKTRKYGLESYRPYSPGQACDGTISACVIALFIDLCKHRNVNPVMIWNAAYPDKKPRVNKKELALTKSFADWQRVAYPKQWDAVQIELMLESLHNANFHQLATTVSEELSL